MRLLVECGLAGALPVATHGNAGNTFCAARSISASGSAVLTSVERALDPKQRTPTCCTYSQRHRRPGVAGRTPATRAQQQLPRPCVQPQLLMIPIEGEGNCKGAIQVFRAPRRASQGRSDSVRHATTGLRSRQKMTARGGPRGRGKPAAMAKKHWPTRGKLLQPRKPKNHTSGRRSEIQFHQAVDSRWYSLP